MLRKLKTFTVTLTQRIRDIFSKHTIVRLAQRNKDVWTAYICQRSLTSEKLIDIVTEDDIDVLYKRVFEKLVTTHYINIFIFEDRSMLKLPCDIPS